MSFSQQLLRTIKANFAAKSTVQLREIASAQDNDETWSPEAIMAAKELLQERQAGNAAEPLVPEKPREAPEFHYDPLQLGLGLLGGLLAGYLVINYYRKDNRPPDLPKPFGPRLAWLALDTKDTEAVAAAIDLRGAHEATWARGVEEAYQSRVFVTPPLGDWTLVASTSLLPTDAPEVFVKPRLERLSQRFREAQYFGTQIDVQLHGWARAREGKLLRGHVWLGKEKQVLWNEGTITREERMLGLKNAEPDEDAVKQLASLWSVDPTTIDEEFKEPMPGMLGRVVWSKL